MRNTGRDEAQAGNKIAGRNTNNLRYADITTPMAESREELKSLLMKVNVEGEKVGLKLNTQNNKIMASDPITSWQIDGKTVETVTDFILGGSKITADGDSLEEKLPSEPPGKPDQPRQLLKKQRYYIANKSPSSQGYVFPVIMYGCESWTMKKAERQRIDALELWCWRRLLKVPWTARRSNQSILKEISPRCSLKALMLKLKLQFFGHLM